MKQFPLLISALLKSEAFRYSRHLIKTYFHADLGHNKPLMIPGHLRYKIFVNSLADIANIIIIQISIAWTTSQNIPRKNVRLKSYSPLTKNILGGDHIMPCVTLLPLSCQYISKDAIFILDVGWALLLYITVHSPKWFLNDVLGRNQFGIIVDSYVLFRYRIVW